MKILHNISRLIAGIVFIFSGVVKAIDPLGSTYKFQDYFLAFNMEFLLPLSLPLTILLCSAEFLSGVSVVFNIRQRTGIWGLMLLMVIFTPLTFVLALTNPVTDCGCFGDVIHLTNWQTFIKNIILLVPVTYLFINRNRVSPKHGIVREWTIISAVTILFLAFILYNIRYLTVIDFLPYKTGTYITDKMKIPDGMPSDKYETTFIYEKDGQQKEFTLDNYPANDTTWMFVDQRSVLVSKGYTPQIHDLVLTTADNEDITETVLKSKGYTFLMICKKLEEADTDKLDEGMELGRKLSTAGFDFYILTASGAEEITKYDKSLAFCSVDETTLKTIVRSNPGYIMLKEGTIMGKWSWAGVPSFDWLKNEYLNNN